MFQVRRLSAALLLLASLAGCGSRNSPRESSNAAVEKAATQGAPVETTLPSPGSSAVATEELAIPSESAFEPSATEPTGTAQSQPGTESVSLTADLVAYDTVRDLADASVAAVRGVAQPGIELLGCEESETICYYFQRIDVADVLASTDGRVVVGDSLNLVSSAPNLLDPDIGRAAAEGRLFLDKFYGSFLSPGDEYVLFINHSAANFSRTTTGVPLYVQTSPGQSFKVVEGGDTIVQDSQVDWPALQRTLGELTGVQLRPPTVQSEAVELMDAPVNLNDLGLLMNG